MSAHVVQWVTASPLWPDSLAHAADDARRQAMRTPALLRFDRDSFMEDVQKLLDSDPAQLKGQIAQKETFRLPAPGEAKPPDPQDLKLYLAIHGHFYLVAATLVCRMPGLPEHEIETAAKETVSFVLRRYDDSDPASPVEWAWVDKSWQAVNADPAQVVDGEELLPLFPLRYTAADRLRRLFVGLVPTSSGDTFKAAGTLSPIPTPSNGGDSRLDALQAKVLDPLRLLQGSTDDLPDNLAGDDRRTLAQKKSDILNAESSQRTEASSFVLLDFAQFLHDNLGWFVDDSWTQPSGTSALWSTTLNIATVSGGPKWREALKTAWADRLKLMGDDPQGLTSSLSVNLQHSTIDPDALELAVKNELPAQQAPTGPVSVQGDVLTEPPLVPKLDARGASWYVLRCVYRRPQCGPLCPDVVSAPTEKFKIASFFDLDAPSRTITISLPIDTSIKDLRKLRKSVSFLLSDQLRQQMNRVTDLNAALKGQFADGQSGELGLMCSFSIPIITICALMVLMIFISLLNIVFWWTPFLRICLPIGLKSK